MRGRVKKWREYFTLILPLIILIFVHPQNQEKGGEKKIFNSSSSFLPSSFIINPHKVSIKNTSHSFPFPPLPSLYLISSTALEILKYFIYHSIY